MIHLALFLVAVWFGVIIALAVLGAILRVALFIPIALAAMIATVGEFIANVRASRHKS